MRERHTPRVVEFRKVNLMGQPRLRIYYGPPDSTPPTQPELPDTTKQTDTVTVPLGEVFPLLGEAVRSDRTWLRDFEDDEVTISADLYEVILAYQHFRRPSA
jgi:hypothetical protein